MLFEPPCAACGRVLDRPLGGAVCDACWTAARSLAHPDGLDRRLEGVDALASAGLYEGRLRDIIHALKYDGRRSIAPQLGAFMREAGAAVLAGADAVVPVPLHWRRERARGFNQAAELARQLGLPVWPLLCRRASTAPQVDLPADQRRRNVAEAFALAKPVRNRRVEDGGSPDRHRLRCAGLTLVLVDDVMTTGATLEACARVLKRAGARQVRALTAARVASGPR